MANVKKLGLFWGPNAFSVIESAQDTPVKTFRIPFQLPPVPDVPNSSINTEDVRLVSVLKEALKLNQVTATNVHLALPSKDIVIRSFIVPFLKPNEIKSVVEFEIKKYIPFNLKELAYSFHTTTFVEDKVKRMRVHFVAIRRENLEHYSSILKQVGLTVVFSEPAPMCLVRALINKKFIKPEQKVAVVQTDFHDSRIIVFDNGVVQFVRDFQLYNPALNTPEPELELVKKKLFNEIKISLDFYMRQFKTDKVAEVLTISFDPNQDFVAQLQQELEIPVRKIDPHTVINYPNAEDVGIINAYGAVLTPAPKTAVFNFSGTVTAPKTSLSSISSQIPDEYIPAVKTAAVCVVLLLVVFILTKFSVAQAKKQYDNLVEQTGVFLDMTPDVIDQRIAENNTKLETLKNIFKKTEMASLLVRVPKLLPEGVWLTECYIQYVDVVEQSDHRAVAPAAGMASPVPQGPGKTGLTLDVAGYAYTKDSNQQFKVVYGVVNMLKSDDLYKKYLKNVTLASIQSEQRDKDTLTSFKINGK